jgi:hypothetical protein
MATQEKLINIFCRRCCGRSLQCPCLHTRNPHHLHGLGVTATLRITPCIVRALCSLIDVIRAHKNFAIHESPKLKVTGRVGRTVTDQGGWRVWISALLIYAPVQRWKSHSAAHAPHAAEHATAGSVLAKKSHSNFMKVGQAPLSCHPHFPSCYLT